jgi:hypothetical protein
MVRSAYSLATLLGQLNAKTPNRNKASDGGIGDAAHQNTVSDHNPDSNGVYHARDFTHDPAGGLDGWWLADTLLKSRDKRIKYIIWQQRIVDFRAGYNPYVWTPYSGLNAHKQHVHVSVMSGALGDQSQLFNLGAVNPAPVEGENDVAITNEDADLIIRRLVTYGFLKEGKDPKTADENTDYVRLYQTMAADPIRLLRDIKAAQTAPAPVDVEIDYDRIINGVVARLGGLVFKA